MVGDGGLGQPQRLAAREKPPWTATAWKALSWACRISFKLICSIRTYDLTDIGQERSFRAIIPQGAFMVTTARRYSGPAGQEDMPYLLTPGPLTTSRTVKATMMADWGSRDVEFRKVVADIRLGPARIWPTATTPMNA
jgi:hypothetical protein